MKVPQTARELIELFKRFHIRADRGKGQNFLVDTNLLRFVAEAAQLDTTDTVLEIGTGTGLLARELSARCGQLITVEIDRALAALASKFLAAHNNITPILGDILKSKSALNPEIVSAAKQILAESPGQNPRLKIVANLPYSISTPFIGICAEGALPFETMVLMVQKEVADRLTAQPGTKDYGFLTAVVRYHCRAEQLRDLPPQVFWPSPKVTSTVIRISPGPVEPPARDYTTFRALARNIFNHRRKSLHNSMVHGGMMQKDKAAIKQTIEDAGFDPEVRGENLSIPQLIILADTIFEASQQR